MNTTKILAFALGAASIFACTKPEFEQIYKSAPVTFYTAGSETKTVFGDLDQTRGYEILWQEGDKVKIYKNYYCPSDATVDINGQPTAASAKMTYKYIGPVASPEKYNFNFFYPSSAVSGVSDIDDWIKLNYPTSQTYSSKSVDPKAQILFAQSLDEYSDATLPTAPISIKFNHLASYGKMTINDLPKDAVVSKVQITTSYDLVGTYQYSTLMDDGTDFVYDITPTSATKALTLTPKESEANPSVVWFACAKHEAKDGDTFEVKVYTTDGKSYTKKITFTADKKIDFLSGQIADFKVSFANVEEDRNTSSYVKVTSEQTDWSGKYLIVYEDTETSKYYAWNGTDAINGYAEVSVTNGAISDKSIAAEVEIASMEGGYSIKVGDKYIYGTSGDNTLNLGSTATLNTLEYVNNRGVKIVSNSSILSFNSASNQMRFRYYKSDNQKPIQLYKLLVPSDPNAPVINITAGTVTTDGNMYSNNTFTIGTAGDYVGVSYTIANPKDGVSLTASKTVDWITFDETFAENEVSFTIAENIGAARSATVTLSYEGASPVTITVNQEGTIKPENYSKTYSYGNLTDWELTNYDDKSTYYLVPSGSTPSVATIKGIFTDKTITSDVTITLNIATYGSGSNPSSSTFSMYTSSDCSTSITAKQSGGLPTSSNYTNAIYTISKDKVSSLNSDLAIKITKPGKQIRLKSITVEFEYNNSTASN